MGKMFSTLSLLDRSTGELYSDYQVYRQKDGEMPQEFLNRMVREYGWPKYEILKVDGVPYEEWVEAQSASATRWEELNTKDLSAVRDETPRKPLPGWGETKRFDPFPDLHRDGFSASSDPGDVKEAGPLHPLQRFR